VHGRCGTVLEECLSNREGERVIVGERLTMRDVSRRGFERGGVDNGDVDVWRNLLEAPTSVASHADSPEGGSLGSISSPVLGRLSPDAHPDVPLTRLKCISGTNSPPKSNQSLCPGKSVHPAYCLRPNADPLD